MHRGLGMFMALGLTALSAAAPPPQRLIVIVAQPNDPRALQQRAALEHEAAALHERDVAVLALTPEAARRERPELQVTPEAAFEVLLVGKDGGVKLRRDSPVAVAEITALIDTMPMRQSETRR
jgi:hypothetical protein